MRTEELKTKMLNGTATAETFENTIKEEGLTTEIIGLIFAYHYTPADLKQEMDKEAKNFASALIFAGQRENDV